jgi:hypothetical protein
MQIEYWFLSTIEKRLNCTVNANEYTAPFEHTHWMQCEVKMGIIMLSLEPTPSVCNELCDLASYISNTSSYNTNNNLSSLIFTTCFSEAPCTPTKSFRVSC